MEMFDALSFSPTKAILGEGLRWYQSMKPSCPNGTRSSLSCNVIRHDSGRGLGPFAGDGQQAFGPVFHSERSYYHGRLWSPGIGGRRPRRSLKVLPRLHNGSIAGGTTKILGSKRRRLRRGRTARSYARLGQTIHPSLKCHFTKHGKTWNF